jgi:polyisoprenoid-binding protein YceI
MLVASLAASLAMAITLPAVAQETYVLDGVHSQPSYTARHLGFANQRGRFGKLTGKVTIDRAAHSGTVDVTIDATSIRTHDARLDLIVRGEKFFDVDKYPTITFKSDHVIFDGDRVVSVDGELTMLGVARKVDLKVDNFICGNNPFNKRPMCGAEATATIKRSDWGMTAGLPWAPADEIRVTLPIEAYRQ